MLTFECRNASEQLSEHIGQEQEQRYEPSTFLPQPGKDEVKCSPRQSIISGGESNKHSYGLSKLMVTWTIARKVRVGLHGKLEQLGIDPMIGSPENC